MSTSTRRWLRGLVAAGLCVFGALGAGGAWAAADPVQVTFTLEGCRNDGTILLPNASGQFVCPDAPYTTGNLGKGWNELDLVPHRITLRNGGGNQTYSFVVAGDYTNNAVSAVGWDVISELKLNSGLSNSATCPVSPTMGPTVITPGGGGVGGAYQTIYRLVTLTQQDSTTCVYDYYQRLAVGAHGFSGSSLQSNLWNQGLGSQGIGQKRIQLPVNEILPQSLRKTMEATADSTVQWGLKKAASPTSINFGDVCKIADEDLSKQVTFRVEWEKTGTVPGGVTFSTKIYAKNPAAREIHVIVTDKVYKGLTQAVLVDQTSSGEVQVPANTEKLVLTHIKTITDGSAGGLGDYLNDVATAKYIDKVTGVDVPIETSAKASAQIQPGVTNDSYAAIADSESMTGEGLKFSVATPAIGAFLNGYTAGTKTTGPVEWGITGETGGRYVDFVKTIYLDGRRVTSGTIYDSAALVADNSPPSFPLQSPYEATASAEAAITSSASVELKISKIIPPIIMTATQTIVVTFEVTRGGDPSYKAEKTLTFTSLQTLQTATLTGLVPDSYTVTEKSSQFCDGSTCGPSGLSPVGSSGQTIVLTAGADGIFQPAECAGTASFTNAPTQGGAFADVNKITDPVIGSGDPDYVWTFTLKGPGLPLDGIAVQAGANAGVVNFKDALPEPYKFTGLAEGAFTVTETEKTLAWVLTNAAPEGATPDKICEFTVDYPADYGKTYSCTFNNQKQGKVQIAKTASGLSLVGTAYAFDFQIREGASTSSEGTTLGSGTANSASGGNVSFADVWLVPGKTYQVCEVVMPGWNTNLSTAAGGPLFVPSSIIPPSLPNPNVNNMTVCVDFSVTAGQTKTFTVDNSPPPGGFARTIGFWKNWASCSKSKGGQKPVLDQTLAAAEPTGIVVSATSGSWMAFGPTYYVVIHGSTTTPDSAPDCAVAENLLDKSTTDKGRKMASDPAFNLAAQLVAAELNQVAGAYSNGTVITAINQAVLLLGKYEFNGVSHKPISSADRAIMNDLAALLDAYNNNRL